MIWAYVMVNALDFLTTLVMGVQYEANPIVKRVLERHGWPGFALGKVLVVLYFVVVTYLLRRMRISRRIVGFYQELSICIMIVVVAWNVRFLMLR